MAWGRYRVSTVVYLFVTAELLTYKRYTEIAGVTLSKLGKRSEIPLHADIQAPMLMIQVWQAYSFDPRANITEAQMHLVLEDVSHHASCTHPSILIRNVGQQLLWTEQSGPENLDPIVWPCAAASAEVFWSGQGGNSSGALSRLHDIGFRMPQCGIHAISVQLEMRWHALRPGECNVKL